MLTELRDQPEPRGPRMKPRDITLGFYDLGALKKFRDRDCMVEERRSRVRIPRGFFKAIEGRLLVWTNPLHAPVVVSESQLAIVFDNATGMLLWTSATCDRREEERLNRRLRKLPRGMRKHIRRQKQQGRWDRLIGIELRHSRVALRTRRLEYALASVIHKFSKTSSGSRATQLLRGPYL